MCGQKGGDMGYCQGNRDNAACSRKVIEESTRSTVRGVNRT